MSSPKILYVCQQITPYTAEDQMALLCRALLQAMQERGCDIRTFMPRWGNINERRNQLHEVIRLSGMNLIINDNDHQLIIKVASIPSARVQIYFIDNEDYFGRKAALADAEGNPFPDNDERALFFARGVLETVRKLRWSPDVVHCHGWFTGLVPLYLKGIFADDPLFRDSKVAVSLHDDSFPGMLDVNFRSKIQSEGIAAEKLEIISEPSYQNLMKLVIDNADAVAVDTPNPDPVLVQYAEKAGKKKLGYGDTADAAHLNEYRQFYDEMVAQ